MSSLLKYPILKYQSFTLSIWQGWVWLYYLVSFFIASCILKSILIALVILAKTLKTDDMLVALYYQYISMLTFTKPFSMRLENHIPTLWWSQLVVKEQVLAKYKLSCLGLMLLFSEHDTGPISRIISASGQHWLQAVTTIFIECRRALIRVLLDYFLYNNYNKRSLEPLFSLNMNVCLI